MRKHLSRYAALLAIAFSLLATSQASASLLLAPTWVATGSPITANDNYNLGLVIPGTPASIGVDFINTLRGMSPSAVQLNNPVGNDYYRSNLVFASLPEALSADLVIEDNPDNVQTLTERYDYISAKYGNEGFIIWRTDAAFWALADAAAGIVGDGIYQITVPLNFRSTGNSANRVSNIRGYNVPEPVSLIAWSLLGGIALIASNRRWHRK